MIFSTLDIPVRAACHGGICEMNDVLCGTPATEISGIAGITGMAKLNIKSGRACPFSAFFAISLHFCFNIFASMCFLSAIFCPQSRQDGFPHQLAAPLQDSGKGKDGPTDTAGRCRAIAHKIPRRAKPQEKWRWQDDFCLLDHGRSIFPGRRLCHFSNVH